MNADQYSCTSAARRLIVFCLFMREITISIQVLLRVCVRDGVVVVVRFVNNTISFPLLFILRSYFFFLRILIEVCVRLGFFFFFFRSFAGGDS